MTHLYKAFTAFLILTFNFAVAQTNSVPTPAKAQTETIILMGGTAHIGNGEVIRNSIIIFEEGKNHDCCRCCNGQKSTLRIRK